MTDSLAKPELAKIIAKTPDAFKVPSGVSNAKPAEGLSLSGGAWDLRAFGWGESGQSPSISGFTLNDSMRVAHELNELISQGELK